MKIAANNLRYEYMWNTHCGQDGAIFGGYLLRFEADGRCWVYSMQSHKEVAFFKLDKSDIIMPHSNAVCFGTEFYDEEDDFPLLYTNLYNSYAGQSDPMEGTVCVYRIIRNGQQFSSKLVQIIRVGFTENLDLWRSLENGKDVRPYGNLVVDIDHSKLYAFTMRDREKVTRFFEFDLPRYTDGVYNGIYGAKLVTLEEADYKSSFDVDYSNYIQGACYYDGKIFSVEGFTVPAGGNPDFNAVPCLRVVDVVNKKQYACFNLHEIGLSHEPELIYYYDDRMYYGDNVGHLYSLIFE